MITKKIFLFISSIILLILSVILIINYIEKLKVSETANTDSEYLKYELTGNSSGFSPIISSSGAQKYLKSSYINKSSKAVKLFVNGKNTNEEIIIEGGSSGFIVWENKTNKLQKYEVEVRCSDDTLLGTIILETSENLFN